ncbi:MAG: hypothetical protein HLUCCO17_03690 [Saliniramus fredricksonii]|uniref:Uncharacterized protein n=1 Tax=Saliniramus fredricksonii TaxID=1653334 RepID=A0A0P7X9L1_9HYPH|nr:MAG: hypothetical protein HLUCCO17_03690 [Saliniramus fredricksonii]
MRFIPTCVGNTHDMPRVIQFAPVHPHVRGEHRQSAAHAGLQFGSSPRAWGTLSSSIVGADENRFIPTCVGNTACAPMSIRVSPVHPHVRGEHHCRGCGETGRGGSSPRAWGTQRSGAALWRTRRFIPTCVGNTGGYALCSCRGSVHPHVRGEHLPRLRCIWRVGGSSPRAWGTLGRITPTGAAKRFIPTCVGNTVRGGVG